MVSEHTDTNPSKARMTSQEGGSSGAAGAESDSSPAEVVPMSTALADGLLSMLGPMVETCDASIQAAVDSQAKVSQQIDRVAAELQGFLGASALPSFAPYAQRLSEVRRRANAAGSTLAAVQQRLARIEAMADRLSAEESVTLQRASQ